MSQPKDWTREEIRDSDLKLSDKVILLIFKGLLTAREITEFLSEESGAVDVALLDLQVRGLIG